MAKSRDIAVNRRATYDYEILERIEAGLVLLSSEIKSIRDNRVNLSGAYAFPQNGELWLQNCHIAPYPSAFRDNHEPLRPRKLLLKKEQLRRFSEVAKQKGYTIVPLKIYISGHYAKIQLGVGQGKKRYDKRRALADRDRRREARDAERR
tara:strand:+ start:572 stop:1021 length:450 start_codon:yes stop_codon:yes gene_type:complete